MPCSRERSDRLDLYAKEVADAWDASGAAAVTHALESIFRREHRFCQSIASRVKYIFYGIDNQARRNSVIKLAATSYNDEIPAAQFTVRACSPTIFREMVSESSRHKVSVCRDGKLVIPDAHGFFDNMLDVARIVTSTWPLTKDAVMMAQHLCEFNLCLRRNEIARTKLRAHVPSLADFVVEGRCVVHSGASKGDDDHTVRDAFMKVSLFDEETTRSLLHTAFHSRELCNEIYSDQQKNCRGVAANWQRLMGKYGVMQLIDASRYPFQPRSFRSLGASFLSQLYTSKLFVNNELAQVELARRVLGHRSRDSTPTYISNVLYGRPAGHVGYVFPRDGRFEDGEFMIVPVSGADKRAAETLILLGNKRRRVAEDTAILPVADRS